MLPIPSLNSRSANSIMHANKKNGLENNPKPPADQERLLNVLYGKHVPQKVILTKTRGTVAFVTVGLHDSCSLEYYCRVLSEKFTEQCSSRFHFYITPRSKSDLEENKYGELNEIWLLPLFCAFDIVTKYESRYGANNNVVGPPGCVFIFLNMIDKSPTNMPCHPLMILRLLRRLDLSAKRMRDACCHDVRTPQQSGIYLKPVPAFVEISGSWGSSHPFLSWLVKVPFYPGVLFLISGWYKRDELAVLGILQGMQGKFGQTAWRRDPQILKQSPRYHLTKASAEQPASVAPVTIFIAICAMFILPDFPHNTRRFTPEKRALAISRFAECGYGRAELEKKTIVQGLWDAAGV
ncbi:hypothetical protein BDR05DRAFT_992412 [Suillus weaverae]|nr:hypothetical protein BDR05DRAFT_992412 [Suillus weaverae]